MRFPISLLLPVLNPLSVSERLSLRPVSTKRRGWAHLKVEIIGLPVQDIFKLAVYLMN